MFYGLFLNLGVWLALPLFLNIGLYIGLMSVARILVRLDLHPGLLKEMTIETASGSFIQPLDYEGIPFICHSCHAYGHGVAD
jgi:hypothetical protein